MRRVRSSCAALAAPGLRLTLPGLASALPCLGSALPLPKLLASRPASSEDTCLPSRFCRSYLPTIRPAPKLLAFLSASAEASCLFHGFFRRHLPVYLLLPKLATLICPFLCSYLRKLPQLRIFCSAKRQPPMPLRALSLVARVAASDTAQAFQSRRLARRSRHPSGGCRGRPSCESGDLPGRRP